MENVEIKKPVAKKVVDNKKLPNNLPESGLNELSPSLAPISPEEPVYTESPDGKYRILKSEFHSERLEENTTNIPVIKIPGWVVVWPHDVKPNTIHNMLARGWQFVRATDPGCEAAGRIISAGKNQALEPARHYAMKIPEAKFKELKMMEEQERALKEESLKNRPSNQSSEIYGTEQMKFSNNTATPAGRMN